jgi:DNA polymerase-3 subunit epsilon
VFGEGRAGARNSGSLRHAASAHQGVSTRPEQLVGQPNIVAVQPAVADYAADTVLGAHNAAFDLRFLQIKEAVTGVRPEQPELDTLLLSAVLHRHTALSDAIVTAQVFAKMLPLLRARGLVTLGQV